MSSLIDQKYSNLIGEGCKKIVPFSRVLTLRETLQKKNDFTWEFFPRCQTPPPTPPAQWVTAMEEGGVWGDVWNLLKLWNFQHWKVHGAYFCKHNTFFNSFELCGGRIEPLDWPERAPFQNLHHNYFSCCQICICPFSCTVGLSVALHEMGSVKFNVYSCVTCKYTNTTTQIQIHKYTNTASIKVADRPNMCYIFEKVMVRGPQK